jgi:hypothetical protein
MGGTKQWFSIAARQKKGETQKKEPRGAVKSKPSMQQTADLKPHVVRPPSSSTDTGEIPAMSSGFGTPPTPPFSFGPAAAAGAVLPRIQQP